MGHLIDSVFVLLDYQTALSMILGIVIGMVVGVLPGLSSTLGVALVIPLTYNWSTTNAFSIIIGLFMSSTYAGSVSAILLGIPGTPAAVMTVLDGYPMTKQGNPGRAIGLATVASVVGGVLGSVVLMLAAPFIGRMALKFGPHEYFAIGFLGMSVLAYVSSGSMLKGVIAACIGLLASTIGVDPVWAYPRFVFGSVQLVGGLELVAILLGMFGFTEILVQIEGSGAQPSSGVSGAIGRILPTFAELRPMLPALLVGSVVGIAIGIVPAVGGATAIVIAYGLAMRISKHPENFGKGAPDAICAVESSNNGCVGGALVPLLSLGIPGDATTVVLFGAFVLHGLSPGPILFQEHPDVTNAIFLFVFVSSILILPAGILMTKVFFSRIVGLKRHALFPSVMLLVIIGCYSVRYSFFDSWIVVLFGVAGFLLKKVQVPLAPVLMGVVLGPIMERNLVRALIIARGDFTSFLFRPISGTIIVASIVVVLIPSLIPFFRGKKTAVRLEISEE